MLKHDEKKNQYEEQLRQHQGKEHIELSRYEIQILNCIKSRSRTEKQIAKMIRFDIFVVSPVITELMLKGYVEIIRKRRLFFFSREYFTITVEGLAALEKVKNPFENLVDLIRERALETIDNISADSPLLKIAVLYAKAAYRAVKMLI
jgi:DNA-binding MarR family transcriptional regulator